MDASASLPRRPDTFLPPPVPLPWLRHSYDRADYPACHDAYRALLQACEAARWAAPPPGLRFHEVEEVARAFARCAREERLRPPVVLEQLREALRPLEEAFRIDVGEVVRLAAWAYYARLPHET